MTTIALVGCASVKAQHPAAARDLYRSQLFRKARAWAERNCDAWFVLSAKHGLLHPDMLIEPYNVRLGDRLTGPPIWEWARRVIDQLHAALADVEDPRLVILAGEQYRSITHLDLAAHGGDNMPWPFEVPMQGLGIGEQLAWLTRELTRPAPVDLSGLSA